MIGKEIGLLSLLSMLFRSKGCGNENITRLVRETKPGKTWTHVRGQERVHVDDTR